MKRMKLDVNRTKKQIHDINLKILQKSIVRKKRTKNTCQDCLYRFHLDKKVFSDNWSHIKVLIFDLGNFDDDTLITYDTDTRVYGSCSATLNGENYVIGGWHKKNQVNTGKPDVVPTKFYR